MVIAGVRMSETKAMTTAPKATPITMPTCQVHHVAAQDEIFEIATDAHSHAPFPVQRVHTSRTVLSKVCARRGLVRKAASCSDTRSWRADGAIMTVMAGAWAVVRASQASGAARA